MEDGDKDMPTCKSLFRWEVDNRCVRWVLEFENPKKLWSLFSGFACLYVQKRKQSKSVCLEIIFTGGTNKLLAKSPGNTFSRPFFGVLLCLVAGKRRRMDARYSSGDWCHGHYCVQQPTTHLATLASNSWGNSCCASLIFHLVLFLRRRSKIHFIDWVHLGDTTPNRAKSAFLPEKLRKEE